MSVVQPPARPAVQVSFGVNTDPAANAEHRRQIAQAVNRLNQGHLNCVLFLTLDSNATSTTITDARISKQTCIAFQPQTANAAAAVATTYAVCTNGSAVVYHASSAETDRTFSIAMVG